MISSALLERLREGNVDLSVDGDELVVRTAGERLDPGLIALLRENKPGLLELLRSDRYAAVVADRAPLIELGDPERGAIAAGVDGGADNVQDVYPLAPLQEGILFHHLLAREGDPYLLPSLHAFERRDLLDAYLGALQAVIDRHDILRTAVVWESLPEPVQVVWRRVRLPVVEVELDPAEGDAAQALWARFDPRRTRLDVRRAPLMRACVARDPAEGRWLLLLQRHHLISDHTTLEVLQEEVRAHLRGRQAELPAPRPFRDFVARARRGASRPEHEAFFRALLGDVEEPTAPFGLLDVWGDGADVESAWAWMAPELAARLRARARALGVSAASVCHVAWGQVLARAAGRDDVVFGTVLLGRMQGGEGAGRAMGVFMNTLPVRLRVGAEGAEAGVRAMHRQLAELLRHEHASLALAQQSSGVPAPAPLFTALLNYRHSTGADAAEAHAARDGVRGLRADSHTNYPLTLAVDDVGGGGLRLQARVRGGVGAERVCAMAHRALEGLVEALERAPGRALAAIDVLPDAERRQLLAGWNAPDPADPGAWCVHERFEAQAERTPEAAAVSFEGATLSYAGLNARANRLAHHLRALGVGPDARVGLCLERSLEMMVGLLAVLKAGGAYLPLDPEYPAERLAWMLADGAPAVVLTQRALAARLQGLDGALALDAEAPPWASCPDTNPARGALTPEHLAYVIYTSGSTGRPKGVMVSHRSLASVLRWMGGAWGPRAHRAVLQKTPVSFDASLRELLPPLLAGGRLVMARPGGHRDPRYLVETVRREGIDTLHFVPSILGPLLEEEEAGRCTTLRAVVCGGEALPAEVARRFRERLPDARLFNVYGPTEAAVDVTALACDREHGGAVVPIGRPMGDVRAYVLDGRGEPLPVGVGGELYLGGRQVARGYRNRPGLTAERFVPDPFGAAPGGRLYRTGDLARWRADGTLEYLGRNDQQVKVRGFRIEPGEVEARLAEHPGVREAVVLAREGAAGDRRLVAWYAADEPLEVEALRRHAGERLPEHMVPAAYVHLRALPLTPNGKVDRRALPAPEGDAYARRGHEAPVGEVETALAGIWADLLGVERVGRRDHFFELGGHSLLAVRLIERMRQRAMHLDVRTLFTTPVLAELAAAVSGESAEVQAPPGAIPPGCEAITPAMLPLVALGQAEIDRIVAGVPGGAANVQDIYPLAPLQEGIFFHHLMAEGHDAYLNAQLLAFDTRARLDAWLDALRRVVDRHDVLRTAVAWEGVREPVQVVWRQARLAVEEVELDAARGDAARQLWARFDPREGRLDIRRAPMMRLFAAADPARDRWVLLWWSHHLIQDHETLEELLAETDAHLQGRAHQLPPAVPYRSYVTQARLGVSPEEHERFFRELLDGVSEPTVPFGVLAARGDGTGVTQARLPLDAELSRRVRARAQALGVSAASVFHLAWAQVLARLSGRDDVVFGTVLFGRMAGGAGADRAMGMLINTLPVRLRVGAEGAAAGVRGAHAQLAALLRHEHASLALAQRCSGVAAPTPLFTSLLNYRHSRRRDGGTKQAEPGAAPRALTGITAIFGEERNTYPLTLNVNDLGDGFRLMAQGVAGIDPQRVCAFVHRALEGLVEALEAAPERPLRGIDVLPEAERRLVVEEWNRTAEHPRDACLHARFEAQVERAPGAAALVFEGESLTYAALNARANRLAHHLAALGVGPDVPVAICVERSPEMVVGLLAVLKAGGGYVPLDPAYPDDRLRYTLADSRAALLLTQGAQRGRFAELGIPVLSLDADAPPWAGLPETNPARAGVAPGNLAYVIYTSGSTGQPKGVMVEHRNVVRLFSATDAWFGFGADDVWTLFHSFAFDFSVWEIWGALLHGGRVVVVPFLTSRSPAHFRALLAREGVTVLSQTPSAFLQLVQADAAELEPLETLRAVVFGGEALQFETLRPWLDRYGPRRPRLVNMYGITETTVHVTGHPVTGRELGEAGPGSPIGRAIPDLRLYVLDPWMNPAPAGVPGEMYVGGAGLARGYLGRPGPTAGRFVPDPFSGEAGARLYRSGDQVRWRADGTLEYLGRIDFQVKIRGFRVETGEIEAALLRHARVREAVVLARPDASGERRLVAYAVPAAEGVAAAELREHLRARLPEHMVPAAFVLLAELPLTGNGKVDRRALPEPDAAATEAEDEPTAPRTPAEELLAGIFAEVLGRERVGVKDDFFALGGHSLRATQLINRVRDVFSVALPLRVLFETPTVEALAAALERARGEGAAVLPPIRRREHPAEGAPLSFSQQRLWFLEQLGGLGSTYHIHGRLRLRGALDREALARALDRLVARHEALRTTFAVANGEPEQRIGPETSRFHLVEHDLAGEADALERVMDGEAAAPFDLERGPLIRGRLLRLAGDDHVLLLTMHHIVSDGWSMGVLVNELGRLYAAFREGRADPLPPLPVQYADYAAWQRRWVEDEVLEAQAAYWTRTLSGAPALLELPTDHPRPPRQDHAGARLPLELDEALTAGLKELSRRHGATLFMALLAGWAAVLGRLSGQPEVVVGTATANRVRAEIEGLIGFFVNTLALRIDLSRRPTVAQALGRVKARALEAQQNQDIPFEQVVERVQPARSLAHAPLFQVSFAWQNAQQGEPGLPGLERGPVPGAERTTAKYDLSLSLREAGGRIVGSMTYATSLFERATVERHLGCLRRVLEQMAADDGRAVDALELLSEAERARVVEEWNRTEAPYPRDRCAHELFEAQVERTPGAAAVVCEGASLTYAELNARANRLAHHLRTLGVGPDARVAICVERSPELVVGVLGTLKAGGAYVPLDPAYPAERLRYLLADSAPRVVLTQASIAAGEAGLFAGGGAAVLALDAPAWEAQADTNPARGELGPAHLAYVVYTSGSTGTPKGVMATHGGVVNLVHAGFPGFALEPESRVLQFASFSFDACVFELFRTLSRGASLCLAAPGTVLTGETLGRTAARYGITHAVLPPAVLEAMPGDESLDSIRAMAVAGDAVQEPLVRRWAPGRWLVNAYGPSEATVCASLHRCRADEPGDPSIGRPIANTRIYLLDGGGEPVPVGVAGELYIGGAGLARGYHGRPGLTAERFVADPFGASPGARLYRTGDLGRWRADGTIAFLGRSDFQVKVRGFRIEPGEIEARLREHEAVREAVVLAREDGAGDRRLAAYYVADEPLDAEALRRHLGERLPGHMVPAAYVHLHALPLTPSGKLDRKALPAPEGEAYARRGYEAPRGEVERALAESWSEVLGVERVGRLDNFFELGGHSLLIVKLLERMRRRGLHAEVGALFTTPTLAQLAEGVSGERAEAAVPANAIPADAEAITPEMLPLVALGQADVDRIAAGVEGGTRNVQDIYALAPLQEGILFHHLLADEGDPYLLSSLYGFARREERDAYLGALQAVIDRHDILRTAVVWEGLPEPVQVVWRRARLAVEEVELDAAAGGAEQALWDRFDARRTRLDVRRAPLMRAAVAHDAAAGRWLLLLQQHHLIGDHTTLEVLHEEIRAHLQGREAELPPPLPFRNFVAQARLGVGRAEHEAFFRALLGDVTEPTAPFGLLDVRGDGTGIREASLSVDGSLAERLRLGARALGVGVATLCHVAFSLLLARVSGRGDVVFGTLLFGRMQGGEGADRSMGMFINTLPVRMRVGAEGAAEAVRRAHGLLAELLRHEHASLAVAQRCSGVAAPAPLFSALLNYRHAAPRPPAPPAPADAPRAWAGIRMLRGQERTNYPFSVAVDDRGDGLRLSAKVHAPVEAARVCAMMHAALEGLVDALERAPEAPLAGIDVLPEAERRRVLEEWNREVAAYPRTACVHELFEAQVERTPDAVAAVFEDAALSYAELNRRANRLARRLRERGVGPDTRVAICVERSLEMVVGVLGILKAGGAYVPLDPAYPPERLRYLLRDSGAAAVLTRGAPAGPFAELDVPVVDVAAADAAHLPEANPGRGKPTPAHLAYVLYTSGSTGLPKGVMVAHGGVVNLVHWMKERWRMDRSHALLQKTPLGFDVSVWELFWPLASGARLVVARPEGHKDPAYLAETIRREGITAVAFVPSMLDLFLAHPGVEGCTSLRWVMSGGEALTPALVRRLHGQLPAAELYNRYAPTEATVNVAAWRCEPGEAGASVPIGRPRANVPLYLLDARGGPVPVGATGELYIGGVQVARGYQGRPGLTAERFVPDPFSRAGGARLYRTGDLARWRPDGAIELVGRNDFQVKVRGLRIELGEVEARLREHPAVREGVVLAREDASGDRRLAAYYVADESLDVEALRRHLGERLPEYMVPAAYVHLQALPLTPNGKLDRRALPSPEDDAYARRGYEAPAGEVERALAEIWSELLGVERVGRRDDFFELGGHSLLIVRLIERMRRRGLHAEVGTLFTTPVLAQLAAAVSARAFEVAVPANAIPSGCEAVTPEMLPLVALGQADVDRIVAGVEGGAGNVQDIYPLAPLQQGILFHHLLTREGDPYLLPSLYGFERRAQVDAYLGALRAVVARHDILRTAVVWEGLPEPVQVVWRRARLEVEEVELEPGTAAGGAAKALWARFDSRRTRLDVRRAPLMRAAVAHDAAEGRWLLLLLRHHIVSDHSSAEVLQEEIRAHLLGREAELPAPLPFRNYVAQTRLGMREAEHEAFFRALLGDVEEPTAPFGLLDVRGDGSNVEVARQRVEPALEARLRARARALGASAASVCHVAWGQVLARVTGRGDVVFGTVLFGRMGGGEGADRTMGLFVNTLPVRVRVGAEGAEASVRAMHRQLAELLRHEHASLALAQRCSGVEAPAPLFTSILNYRHQTGAKQARPLEAEALGGMRPLRLEVRTNYPAELSVDDYGDAMRLSAHVPASVGARRVCALMHRALEALAEALEATPERAVGTLDVLPEAERRRVVEEWNRTDAAYPRESCIHALFEAQVARTPDAVAVVFGGAALSYAGLNRRANRLAHRLRRSGVRPDTRVGLCVERGLEMMVGLLAVLKAGGAYVPLDPGYPAERLRYMLADSRPAVLLTRASILAAEEGLSEGLDVEVLDLDAPAWEDEAATNPERGELIPAHLAYVTYTSGSTGQPKGVMVAHGAVVNLVHWYTRELEISRHDAVLIATSYAFDLTQRNLFGPLLSGGRLHLAREPFDPRAILAQVRDSGLTLANLTSTAFHALIDAGAGDALAGMRFVVLGGEAARPEKLLELAPPRPAFANAYGPTECSGVVTHHRLAGDLSSYAGRPVPLGEPIANSRIYILDGAGEPAPVGVVGELHVGGVQVARGYLDRPALTAARFVPDPFGGGPGARLYRTGDLGRWRADGSIEFAGRNDFQVKVRGFRVELGEVEARLREHPAVREAVVVAREAGPGDQRLLAYWVGEDEVGAEALRRHVGERLPEYMVPAAYVHLERLPTTPSGKLDRRALPSPEGDACARRAYEAPQGEVEEALAEIWSEVLRVERVGRQDHFFELGGHSLLVVRVVSRVRQLLGVELELGAVFDQPVLASLAERILDLQLVQFDPGELERLVSSLGTLSLDGASAFQEPG